MSDPLTDDCAVSSDFTPISIELGGVPTPQARRIRIGAQCVDMHRRRFLHGIGMGAPGDPGNTQLVLVPRGPELTRLHHALCDALRDEPSRIFALPASWLHLTLDYRWDPVPGNLWQAPQAPIASIQLHDFQVDATPWSLRLIPDDQAAIARVAEAYGVTPPDGGLFAITLAYSTGDVPAADVARILTRMQRALASTGATPRPNGPITFDRVERRRIEPDMPLCWDLLDRWPLQDRQAMRRLKTVPASPALAVEPMEA